MRPIDPGHESGHLVELAKDDPRWAAMPVRVAMVGDYREIASRWQLSDEERHAIAAGADLTLTLVGAAGWPPLRLQVAGVPPDRADVYSREELVGLVAEAVFLARQEPRVLAPVEDKNSRITGWQFATPEQLAEHGAD